MAVPMQMTHSSRVLAVRDEKILGIKAMAKTCGVSCKQIRDDKLLIKIADATVQKIVQKVPKMIGHAHRISENVEVYLRSAHCWAFPLGMPIKLELAIPRHLLPFSSKLLQNKYGMKEEEAESTIKAIEKEMLPETPHQTQVAIVGASTIMFEKASDQNITFLEEMDGLVKVIDAANSTLIAPVLAAIEIGAFLLRKTFLRIGAPHNRLVIGVGIRVCSYDETSVPFWPVCVSINDGKIMVVKGLIDRLESGRVAHVYLVLYCDDQSQYLVDFAPEVVGGKRVQKVPRDEGPPGSEVEESAFPEGMLKWEGIKKLVELVDLLSRSQISLGRKDEGFLAALALRLRRYEALAEGIPVTPTDPSSPSPESQVNKE